jgi:hypothetical protein
LIYLIIATNSLDIFWLRDESLEESDNLPDPDVLAQEKSMKTSKLPLSASGLRVDTTSPYRIPSAPKTGRGESVFLS